MTQFKSRRESAYTCVMTGPQSETELAKALRRGESKRVTPLDAFHAAKRKWLGGERIEIGALAVELGVGRATLFRWIGSREKLLGEILWSVCAQTLVDTGARIHTRGPRRIATILQELVLTVRESPPMRRFLEEDPEYALRLVTSRTGPVQSNMVAEVKRMLAEEVARGAMEAPLPLDTLAFLVVRVCESFVYAEAISGGMLGAADVRLAVELLLSGRVEKESQVSGGTELP